MSQRNPAKHVVIYGGGVAGAMLAKTLSSSVQVTLVDPTDYFEVPMAATRSLVCPDFAEQAIVPFSVALPKVNHVQGRLVAMTPVGGVIRTHTGRQLTLEADVAVLATGSQFVNELMRGTDGQSLRRKRFYAQYSRRIDAAKQIVIVGGGPIGVEVAGEIAETHRGKQVTIVEAGQRMLGGSAEALASHATKLLRERGVTVLTGTKLIGGGSAPSDILAPGGIAITSRGDHIPYDLMIWCTGGRPNTGYMQSHFASALNDEGRIKVTPSLRVLGQSTLYALGDITDLDENKMAMHIGGHVRVAAWNIRQTLAGIHDSSKLKSYRPQTNNPSMVVTMGSQSGVAYLKGLGLVKSGFIVRMVKARHLLVPRYRKALGT